MRFYHFTSVSHLEMLLSNGGLKKGRLTRSNGAVQHPVVWLTTDSNPEKQGLTTGKEMPVEGRGGYPANDDGRRSKFAPDRTQIRIEVSVDDSDDKLMSFFDYCARYESPLFARRQGILGAYNLDALSPAESSALMFSGVSKERTWWLYWDTIPAGKFEGIAFNSDNGFVPYSFATNGRAAFKADGLSVVSDTLLESLAKLICPSSKYETVKAYSCCIDPNHVPNVVIQGGGKLSNMSIITGELLSSESPQNSSAISEWIRKHKRELLLAWDEAISLLNAQNP